MSKAKKMTMASAFNAGAKAATAAAKPGGASNIPASCDTLELRSAFMSGFNITMQHKREAKK